MPMIPSMEQLLPTRVAATRTRGHGLARGIARHVVRHAMRHAVRRVVRSRVLVTLTIGAALGCLGDQAIAPAKQSASSALGPAVASPLNAIIAVGETLSVALHVKTLAGEPVTSFDSVEYVLGNVSDTQFVQVSQTGVLTGKQVTRSQSPVIVGMIAFKDGAVAYDAALVQVTPTMISGVTLSVQPSSPEDAYSQAGSDRYLSPVVMNPITDSAVSGVALRLEFRPNDSSGVRCQSFPVRTGPTSIAFEALTKTNCVNGPNGYYNVPNAFFPVRPETLWVHATVLAYGTVLHDSAQYIITNPNTGSVYVTPNSLSSGVSSNPLDVAILPGGTVVFTNAYDPAYGTSIDFIFDDSAAVTADPGSGDPASGNIRGVSGGGSTSRQFLTAGTYGYTYVITDGVAPFKGATGRGTITVQ